MGAIDMAPRHACTIFISLIFCYVGNAFAFEDSIYRGVFEKANVFVVVELKDGWGLRNISVGMGCDGRLRISGAYSDTTVIRSSASPDSALALVNGLLAMDFFGQPKLFKAECGRAVLTEDGRIAIFPVTVMESAGSTQITLYVGLRKHTVQLRMPAYGAPEGLITWERKFRGFVGQYVEWLGL
jgi:hypothetical protein